ncbi:MAG: hypothetical protein GY820_02865 [Gammaproteobacteria bacterium]|nr:hypothetical protein [Gammaproteobacteria bacterium]
MTTKLSLVTLIPLGVSFLLSVSAVSATAAGFRELSAGNVKFGIWYPSETQPSMQRLGPFEVEIAKNAPIKVGNHEIILFSHGNSGRYRNHYLTAQALADAGFVVIAPQHEADYLIGGRKTAPALDHRYLELSEALNAVLTAPEFMANVNQEKVHGLGYSLGGATILLASGAGYSSQRTAQHCRDNRASDVTFCEDPGWVFRFIQSFRHDVNLRPTPDPFHNPPLINGKVVLVAPVFQGIDVSYPLSMNNLTMFAIEGDKIAIPKFHARPLYDMISRDIPSNYQTIPGHHYAFIAPFPKWLIKEEHIPVAEDPEDFDRSAFLAMINAKIVAAFMRR